MPRWQEHRRREDDRVRSTALRAQPSVEAAYAGGLVLEDEVVEVVDPSAEPTDGFVLVRRSRGVGQAGAEGWMRSDYLHASAEGTDDHDRLSARNPRRRRLEETSSRFKELGEMVSRDSGGEYRLASAEHITGHTMGATGLIRGNKTVLYHGTDVEAADAIAMSGFDDNFACDGKFGPGLYFSPELSTALGYSDGETIFVCEVALGDEEQRITATHCSTSPDEYTWKKLLAMDKRSVQCHKDVFGQEERIVYHCTQCKPVFLLKVVRLEPRAPLRRWMEHQRRADDHISKTGLRANAGDAKANTGFSLLNGDVVEVLDPERDPGESGGFVKVRHALGHEGWVRADYLVHCPEGTAEHGRLTATGRTVAMRLLQATDSRFKAIKNLIAAGVCSGPRCCCRGADFTVESIWFVHGQYLGMTGMVTGTKEVLFHGAPDEVVQQIARGGFDIEFCSAGSFGKGHYFSPQSCKAFAYAENYLLVCEVALGVEDKRLTVTAPDHDLTYETVSAKGCRSVQCHAGSPFNHEERIVYRSTQCKVTYLVKMATTSPGGGV